LELEVENKSAKTILQRARQGLEQLEDTFSHSLLSPLQLFQTLAGTQEESVAPTYLERRNMDTQLLIEERHALLKSELDEKLQEKHTLELEISRQFQELKKLEISLEKRARNTVTDEQR
jgi:hypothetical protein